MLVLFLNFISCLYYELGTGDESVLKFDTEAKANELLKFEYNEDNELTPDITIIDSFGREVAHLNTNYTVLHWSGSTDNVYYIQINNNTKRTMNLYLRMPDVNQEVTNALGPVTDKDVVAEYEHSLKKGFADQRSFLDRLKEHESLTLKMRRMVSWLIVVEVVSCCGFIYYLHKKTVSLFEKKQRA